MSNKVGDSFDGPIHPVNREKPKNSIDEVVNSRLKTKENTSSKSWFGSITSSFSNFTSKKVSSKVHLSPSPTEEISSTEVSFRGEIALEDVPWGEIAQELSQIEKRLKFLPHARKLNLSSNQDIQHTMHSIEGELQAQGLQPPLYELVFDAQKSAYLDGKENLSPLQKKLLELGALAELLHLQNGLNVIKQKIENISFVEMQESLETHPLDTSSLKEQCSWVHEQMEAVIAMDKIMALLQGIPDTKLPRLVSTQGTAVVQVHDDLLSARNDFLRKKNQYLEELNIKLDQIFAPIPGIWEKVGVAIKKIPFSKISRCEEFKELSTFAQQAVKNFISGKDNDSFFELEDPDMSVLSGLLAKLL